MHRIFPLESERILFKIISKVIENMRQDRSKIGWRNPRVTGSI